MILNNCPIQNSYVTSYTTIDAHNHKISCEKNQNIIVSPISSRKRQNNYIDNNIERFAPQHVDDDYHDQQQQNIKGQQQSQQLRKLEEQVKFLIKENEFLKTQTETSLRVKYNNKKLELSRSQDTNKLQKEEVAGLKNKMESLNNEHYIQTLENNLEDLEATNEELESKYKNLELKFQAINISNNEDIIELKTSNKQLKDENGRLKKKMENKNEENNFLNLELLMLKKEEDNDRSTLTNKTGNNMNLSISNNNCRKNSSTGVQIKHDLSNDKSNFEQKPVENLQQKKSFFKENVKAKSTKKLFLLSPKQSAEFYGNKKSNINQIMLESPKTSYENNYENKTPVRKDNNKKIQNRALLDFHKSNNIDNSNQGSSTLHNSSELVIQSPQNLNLQTQGNYSKNKGNTPNIRETTPKKMFVDSQILQNNEENNFRSTNNLNLTPRASANSYSTNLITNYNKNRPMTPTNQTNKNTHRTPTNQTNKNAPKTPTNQTNKNAPRTPTNQTKNIQANKTKIGALTNREQVKTPTKNINNKTLIPRRSVTPNRTTSFLKRDVTPQKVIKNNTGHGITLLKKNGKENSSKFSKTYENLEGFEIFEGDFNERMTPTDVKSMLKKPVDKPIEQVSKKKIMQIEVQDESVGNLDDILKRFGIGMSPTGDLQLFGDNREDDAEENGNRGHFGNELDQAISGYHEKIYPGVNSTKSLSGVNNVVGKQQIGGNGSKETKVGLGAHGRGHVMRVSNGKVAKGNNKSTLINY